MVRACVAVGPSVVTASCVVGRSNCGRWARGVPTGGVLDARGRGSARSRWVASSSLRRASAAVRASRRAGPAVGQDGVATFASGTGDSTSCDGGSDGCRSEAAGAAFAGRSGGPSPRALAQRSASVPCSAALQMRSSVSGAAAADGAGRSAAGTARRIASARASAVGRRLAIGSTARSSTWRKARSSDRARRVRHRRPGGGDARSRSSSSTVASPATSSAGSAPLGLENPHRRGRPSPPTSTWLSSMRPWTMPTPWRSATVAATAAPRPAMLATVPVQEPTGSPT